MGEVRAVPTSKPRGAKTKAPAQRWSPGAVVRIPLGGGFFGYGQMLTSPEYAFFDVRTSSGLTAEAAVGYPLLFRLWVMRYAHSKGRWLKVGASDVAPALAEPVQRFNQDPISGVIRITIDGFSGPIGSVADCENLECAAVWDPEHVESRLRDHFEGRPNPFVRSLRPRSRR